MNIHYTYTWPAVHKCPVASSCILYPAEQDGDLLESMYVQVYVQSGSLQQQRSGSQSAQYLAFDLSLSSFSELDIQLLRQQLLVQTVVWAYTSAGQDFPGSHSSLRYALAPRDTQVLSYPELTLRDTHPCLLLGHYICLLASPTWSSLAITHSQVCTCSSGWHHGHRDSLTCSLTPAAGAHSPMHRGSRSTSLRKELERNLIRRKGRLCGSNEASILTRSLFTLTPLFFFSALFPPLNHRTLSFSLVLPLNIR